PYRLSWKGKALLYLFGKNRRHFTYCQRYSGLSPHFTSFHPILMTHAGRTKKRKKRETSKAGNSKEYPALIFYRTLGVSNASSGFAKLPPPFAFHLCRLTT